MGDSGIAAHAAIMASILIAVSIAAVFLAWRVRNKILRIVVGLSLVLLAGASGVLSIIAALVLGALGLATLISGVKTAKGRDTDAQIVSDGT
jgi:hypothetical protein